MAMTAAYLDSIRTSGRGLITHLGLVDAAGTELSGGSYTRLPANLVDAAASRFELAADHLFEVPAGATVAGWRGFSALTAGTNFGGADLVPNETFAADGEYRLLAGLTGVTHSST